MTLRRLRAQERIFAWRLATGRCISHAEIIEAMWSNDPRGGPDRADISIRNLVSTLRAALKPCGVDLISLTKTADEHPLGFLVHASQLDLMRDLLAAEVDTFTVGSSIAGPVIKCPRRVRQLRRVPRNQTEARL